MTKIAEASYGEVYRLSVIKSEDAPQMSISRNEESVLKIIALQPPVSTLPTQKRDRQRAVKKAEAMSKPADVASEVKLLQRMSSIPGFTNFRDARVLQGRPPQPFVAAFAAFNAAQKADEKEPSTFPDPARKASYREDQLWAVIEMQDAGTDLERLVERRRCGSIWAVWDVFWHVVLALAKGEEAAEFEHRDLHLGNICVRNPDHDAADAGAVDVRRKLGFTGLEATLIDYTISRAAMPTASSDARNAEIAYLDLSKDSHIFAGDSAEEYQYEIYRYMRSAVFLDDALARYPPAGAPLPSSPPPHPTPPHSHPQPLPAPHPAAGETRSWSQFHPQTNLIWLHFVLHTLLKQPLWPSEQRPPARPSKRTKKAAASATAAEEVTAERAVRKRAAELEAALRTLQDLLQPGAVGREGMRSAGDLVGMALGEGWLDVEDVVGGDEAAEGTEGLSGLDEAFATLDLRARIDVPDGCHEKGEERAKRGGRKKG